MKKILSYILVVALILSCVPVAFAVEAKDVVIDTSVPLFKDLEDGGSYKAPKDIYIADLSKVNYIILKSDSSSSVEFQKRKFPGYKELKQGTDFECINYTKVYTVDDIGTYLIYAIDEFGHGTMAEFIISSKSTGGNGGGGGGGGGGGTVITVKQPYANGDPKNVLGTLYEGETITLATDTSKATIYYTTDGKKPTTKSLLYDDKTVIVLEKGQTLKAVAEKSGNYSEVSEWKCVAKPAEPDEPSEPGIVEPGNNGGNATPGGPGSTGSIVGTVLEADNHIVYMTGYPEGTFCPDNNMTRAEVATMFARLMKDKMDADVKYPSTFTDVESDAWYADYIGYMQKFEVIKGYEDGTFAPDKTITRAEFVTIASRFASMNQELECNFVDVNSNHWAYNYIAFAAYNGWVGGYEDGTFAPDKTITRAEVVTIVNNMLVRKADIDYVNSNKASLILFSDVTPAHWAYFGIIEATNAHDYSIVGGKELWK